MKNKYLTQNIGYFILAVLIIIVYKTFDSLGEVFKHIGEFFALLSPVFGAFAIAFVLYPACKKLEDMLSKFNRISRHKRGISVAIVYFSALVVVAGFLALLFPLIYKSISDLITRLPSIVENVIAFLYSVKLGGYSLKPMLDTVTINDIVNTANLTDIDLYLNSITSVSKWLIDVLLSVIISIYILLDRAGFLKTVRRVTALIIPEKGKEAISKYAYQSFSIMYKYVYCQLIDMLVVATLAFCTLMIMGVEYAPILAIFIGVANLVPYFGATVACILSALLTLFTASLSKAVVVAIVLIVLQQIDANIIQPKIVKNALKVKPFWVLCGVLVGGGLFGIAGIILAVPVIAFIKIIIEDIFDYRRVLSKRNSTTEETTQNKAKKPTDRTENIPKEN